MLGSNEKFDLTKIKYPTMGLFKYDGIRGTIKDGKLLSRALKPIPNSSVQKHPAILKLKETSLRENRVIDVELYIDDLPFNEHTIFIMTKEYNRKHMQKIKGKLRRGELSHPYNYYMRLPKEFKVILFDTWDAMRLPYKERYWELVRLSAGEVTCKVANSILLWKDVEVVKLYEEAIEKGLEGLVLRNPEGKYKFGRATAKEETFLKLKPITELRGTVLRVEERRKNLTESHINELGYQTKRQLEENQVTTGIASALVVEYEGKEVKVTLTGTEETRREILNDESWIGSEILFKAMLYGSLNKPRHPVFLKRLTM
ncbi:hypothetical protein KAU11_10645 [Candidatus Babeliales bacterium]|nr:hypothetical protein [Candidatus Babeliales bacterium]